MSWADNARLLRTSDGTVAVAFSYFSSDQCAVMLKIATVDPERGTIGTELGAYVVGASSFDLATRDGELLVVFTGEDGRLHLVEVSITGSGPIGNGSTLPSRCPTS